LVYQRNELGPHQLVELIAMQVDCHLTADRGRQSVIHAKFIDMPSHAHQIGKHGVAYCLSYLEIAQCIKTHIDNAALSDYLQPIEYRPGIFEIIVVWR